MGMPTRTGEPETAAHRFGRIAGGNKNHSKALLLCFPAETEDIGSRRVRPQDRVIDQGRKIPFRLFHAAIWLQVMTNP